MPLAFLRLRFAPTPIYSSGKGTHYTHYKRQSPQETKSVQETLLQSLHHGESLIRASGTRRVF